MAIPQLQAIQPWRLKRSTFSNANYTVLATDVYVAQIGTFSAARTATLPSASSFGIGCVLIIADEAGGVTSTNTLTIARAGSDTISGATSLVLNAAFSKAILVSDGVSKWTKLV